MTSEIRQLIDKYRKDYDSVSVHISSSSSRSVSLDCGELETADFSESRAFYVRCLRDHRLMSSVFTGADVSAVESFFKESAKVIGSMPADELRCMPSFDTPLSGVKTSDGGAGNAGIDELIKTASDITETALSADSRVNAVKQATASVSARKMVLLSTEGPELAVERTLYSAGAYLIASEKGEERDGYDSVSSVLMNDLNFKESALLAVENACSLLGARQINSGRYHIVFSASVMADFVELLLDLVDGDNVFKGLSMLSGKKGSKVASGGFTLWDDPLVDFAVGSGAFDDEGQPSEKVEIISGGVLNSYLHNSYTANALGEATNARAVLTGGGSMAVGCTNVHLASTASGRPEDHSKEFLKITEVMGMHTADPVSGNFSVGISGIYYKNGEQAYPFREAVISGSLKELLSGMIHVFDNRRTFGNITTADTLFDKMSVSGV